MAAQSPPAPTLVELSALAGRQLAPLLEEEKARWLALLHWDFSPLAELILRYAGMGTLEGFALMEGGEPAGYAYYVTESGKGLIGDFFLRDAWRSPANENRLLGAVVERLLRMPWLGRIEAQLMHLCAQGSQLAVAGLAPRAYPRQFMLANLAQAALQPGRAPAQLHLERWSAWWTEPAAALIAEAYRGHVDSEINNQYRTEAGARRFLENIVRYPGCGFFAPDCSWVAVDADGGLAGACLATRIGPGAGHIAQICVAPAWQGRGAGEELLRRSLASLRDSGLSEASLTVTSANTRAIRLYEKYGFRAIHHFDALVWELPGREAVRGPAFR
ncbi:MAG: GNAT family N-acetyltransferase [Bryobacteraceae bacterium]|nr:GNAT family N-acetyltransferase [Bryobacteraceae bacterium]MCX7603917.1 GNAT family N-acetyltransferase [Bryobacteraceae bacterium]